jgi:flagellar basal body-associated protein FliL
MAGQTEEEVNTNENKYMWIAVAVIVLIIVGGMGVNMLVHKETSADTVEVGSQKSPQK